MFAYEKTLPEEPMELDQWTPKQFATWLSNNHSDRYISAFSGFSGADISAMSAEDLNMRIRTVGESGGRQRAL